MTKLGVNIDHTATLRQARYINASDVIIEPNILNIAKICKQAHAHNITMHLREDRRHVQDKDIFDVRENVAIKLNMEMGCNKDILDIALKLKPDFACLVPENRMEITTEGGLNLKSDKNKVAEFVKELTNNGTQVSIFIDPDISQIEIAKQINASAIELHTGSFANAWLFPDKLNKEIQRLKSSAEFAESIGLTVNAGHGINYVNITTLMGIFAFNELNIGHSIIAKSLECGLHQAITQMKNLIEAKDL